MGGNEAVATRALDFVKEVEAKNSRPNKDTRGREKDADAASGVCAFPFRQIFSSSSSCPMRSSLSRLGTRDTEDGECTAIEGFN